MQSFWLCSLERRRWTEWLPNWMTVKLQPTGIMERAERDFSGQSLGASSGQQRELAQLAASHVQISC